MIKQIAAAVAIPVIGIGGITQANAAGVLRAGASGVSVISAVLEAPDCGNAARGLREALDAAWTGMQQVMP